MMEDCGLACLTVPTHQTRVVHDTKRIMKKKPRYRRLPMSSKAGITMSHLKARRKQRMRKPRETGVHHDCGDSHDEEG